MMEPIPPYDFSLTVRKPAGWPLFTPFEVYEERTLWTAAHIRGHLVGVRLASRGTLKHPKIAATIFLEGGPASEKLDEIESSLAHSLGADGGLTEFYETCQRGRHFEARDRGSLRDAQHGTCHNLPGGGPRDSAADGAPKAKRRDDELLH